MSDRPDPKEIKLLADILALVLEDQAGQSSSALDAIRRRAAANRVTGGAIKNLFMRLTAGDAEPERAMARSPGANPPLRELDAAKLEIAALQGERYQLQRQLVEAEARHREALELRKSSARIGAACGALGALGLAAVILVVGNLRARPTETVAAQERPAVAAAAPPHATAPAPITALPPLVAAAAPGRAPPAASLAPPGQPFRMSDETRRAVAEHVRTCWVDNTGVLRPTDIAFDIQVQIDESGTIRGARLTGEDAATQANPGFRAFADHAVQALLDPRCATLPLPPAMLGHQQVLDFHFAP